MAHTEQREFFQRVKDKHPEFFADVSVLDVGSLNINGTVRDFFTGGSYVGVDLAEGAGVDVVGFGESLDFADGSFDVCLSAECFEHNPEWVATFANMVRMCSGLVMVSCATAGRAEHGTSRSHPGSSPLSVQLWDYYRNLTEADFVAEFDLGAMFSSWLFEVNEVSCDLYLVGFVK